MVIILVLLAKHFKMKALVSMLAIQTVPPPAEAVNLTAAMMSAMIAPDPAIGTKVVCAYPVAVIWQNILGYLVLVYAITQFFRPVTWCKGYKYNKKSTLYIFVYDEDHERYSPLKIVSLKGQMHIENSKSERADAQLQNEAYRRRNQSDPSEVMDL